MFPRMDRYPDPLTLIQDKRRRLAEERHALLSRVQEIDKELLDQETAIRVIRELLPPEPDVQPAPLPAGLVAAAKAPAAGVQKPPLVKDMVLAILKDAYPRGLTAAEIRQGAIERFGATVNPNTLTVSLGRFKAENLVSIEGRQWRYTPTEAEKTEAVSSLFQ